MRVEVSKTGDHVRGVLAMSIIPLHLQRKFEQRWAARFVRPVASAAPKATSLKGTATGLPSPAKEKEKPAGFEAAGLVSVGNGAR
jgi:hypothetical protein